MDSNEPVDDLSPKADAEDLESSEVLKDDEDNEEQHRFAQYVNKLIAFLKVLINRGSALQFNTDTFTNQDIEVSAIKAEDTSAVQQSHLLISAIIVSAALVSIGLYVGLVVWRSHLRLVL